MDAVGAASAIIQIAGFGLETSVKLATFAGQVKSSPERIASLAEDVSLNSSVLKQLGELMKEGQDPEFRDKKRLRLRKAKNNLPAAQSIFSAEGLDVTMKAAKKCDDLFKSLESSLVEASSQLKSKRFRLGAKIQLSMTEMIKWPFLVPEIDRVKAELRDSKATLMLMLQIVSLAHSRRMAEGRPQDDESLCIRSIVIGHGSQSPESPFKIGVDEEQGKYRLPDIPAENNEKVPQNDSNTGGFLNAISVPDHPRSFIEIQRWTKGPNYTPTLNDASCSGIKENPTELPPKAPTFPAPWHVRRRAASPPTIPPDTTTPRFHLITPEAVIINNKIQIRYHTRPIKGIPSVLMNPDLWHSEDKSTDKGTMAEQWAALSLEERSAIQQIKTAAGGAVSQWELDWIHTGELKKVPLEVPSARSITVLVKKPLPSILDLPARDKPSYVSTVDEEMEFDLLSAQAPAHYLSGPTSYFGGASAGGASRPYPRYTLDSLSQPNSKSPVGSALQGRQAEYPFGRLPNTRNSIDTSKTYDPGPITQFFGEIRKDELGGCFELSLPPLPEQQTQGSVKEGNTSTPSLREFAARLYSKQDKEPGLENEDGDTERAEELVRKLLNKFTTL